MQFSDDIPTVHEHIGIIQQLRSAATGADRRALLYLQAQYGEFASWLHQDAGDFRMAQHWTDRALEWSQTARDPEMTAYILARKSQLAGDMRDPDSAIDYAEAALELVPPRSRVKAAAAAYAAHGYALAGEHGHDAALRMHDDARATLADLDSDPASPWAVWMNDAYLDVERARCLSMLGKHNDAAEAFQQAIRELPVDGYIDDTGPERLLLSNEADFDRVDQVRAGCDAILIGATTLRRDNPREVELARQTAAGRSLDEEFPGKTGNLTLRWVYLHMIEEYARHNGHADLLREAIDGVTGE